MLCLKDVMFKKELRLIILKCLNYYFVNTEYNTGEPILMWVNRT